MYKIFTLKTMKQCREKLENLNKWRAILYHGDRLED